MNEGWASHVSGRVLCLPVQLAYLSRRRRGEFDVVHR